MDADTVALPFNTQQKRDHNDSRPLPVHSDLLDYFTLVNCRPHVELVTENDRIQLIGPNDNGSHVVVEVDGCLLKFCGSADHTGRPSSGLCLKKKGNDDSVLVYEKLQEPVKSMVSRTHILSCFLTAEEIDMIESSHYGDEQKRSNRALRNHYTLTINYEDFSEEVYCLIYSLADAFQSTSCDGLTVFIGEYDNAYEKCGLKMAQSNSFEGVISKSQSSRRKCQVLTFPDKVFQGDMKDTKPNGMGSVTFLSGYQFVGNHNMGVMGFGFYGRVGTSSVISLWSHGNRDIFSIEEYGRGNIYIGGYERGKRQGAGVLILSNGSICFGEWKDGVLYGLGSSFGYTGHVYMGEVNRAFKGYGEMYYKNYSYYKGFWDGNQYSGKGVLFVTKPDGSRRYYYSEKWDHGSVLADNNTNPLRDRVTSDDIPHSAAGESTEELPL